MPQWNTTDSGFGALLCAFQFLEARAPSCKALCAKRQTDPLKSESVFFKCWFERKIPGPPRGTSSPGWFIFQQVCWTPIAKRGGAWIFPPTKSQIQRTTFQHIFGTARSWKHVVNDFIISAYGYDIFSRARNRMKSEENCVLSSQKFLRIHRKENQQKLSVISVCRLPPGWATACWMLMTGLWCLRPSCDDSSHHSREGEQWGHDRIHPFRGKYQMELLPFFLQNSTIFLLKHLCQIGDTGGFFSSLPVPSRSTALM